MAGVNSEQDTNKAIVADFNRRSIVGGDMELYAKTIDPAFVDHTPHPDQVAGAPNYYMQLLRGAFPDLEVVLHDQLAEGDKVVTRKSYRGTHRGEFLGIAATGRAVDLAVIDIIRLQDGRFVEHWSVVDLAGLTAQLTKE